MFHIKVCLLACAQDQRIGETVNSQIETTVKFFVWLCNTS